MRLTILGNQGPYPGPGGATSGYLLEVEGRYALLDCGSGILARLWQQIRPEQLEAVVLSHLHADHMADLLVLRYQMALRSHARLAVYAPEAPPTEHALLKNGPFDLRPLREGEGYEAAGMAFSCFPGRHPVPSYAMRFEKAGRSFVYTGDTNQAEGMADFARDAGLLLADAAFTQDQWDEKKPHMSARLAAELARQAGAKRLVLTHFAPEADPQALLREARDVYPAAERAEPGETWDI